MASAENKPAEEPAQEKHSPDEQSSSHEENPKVGQIKVDESGKENPGGADNTKNDKKEDKVGPQEGDPGKTDATGKENPDGDDGKGKEKEGDKAALEEGDPSKPDATGKNSPDGGDGKGQEKERDKAAPKEGDPSKPDATGKNSPDGGDGKGQEKEGDKAAPKEGDPSNPDTTGKKNSDGDDGKGKEKDGDKAAPQEKPEGADPNGGSEEPKPALIGWLCLGLLIVLAVLVSAAATLRAVAHPRTDDAEVFANFIGMSPLVDGPILALPIRDNQFVRAGTLLFAIDDRPYKYALERALSDQAALEGQIEDRRRSIHSQISGVHVAAANVVSSAFNREAMQSDIREAEADVGNAKAALRRDEADLHYAEDNLHRLEPLLVQQFVTVDEVDKARTLVQTRGREVQQAVAQVEQTEASVRSHQSHFEQSGADVDQRLAQRDQAANGVQTLDPLTNQREERAAAIRQAQYNLNNCRVYAPFDGYVTNLTTSLGAYVHTGTQVFTMIDDRTWWVVANFRETQLKHVAPGSNADVFLMARDNLPLRGVVESIGYGVTPDPSVAGVITPGLPDIDRNLSWVHLASRYPVRIRIESPPAGLLRIGQSAVAVIQPLHGTGR